MTHSPEPWTRRELPDCHAAWLGFTLLDATGVPVPGTGGAMADNLLLNADRIAACVNALQGIADPVAFMAAVRNEITSVTRILEEQHNEP